MQECQNNLITLLIRPSHDIVIGKILFLLSFVILTLRCSPPGAKWARFISALYHLNLALFLLIKEPEILI